MGQTLTHGIYLPDEGERNCYNGLASNWSILDGAVGTIAEHTTQIAGKAAAVHTHVKSDVTDLFNSANTWSGENTFSNHLYIYGQWKGLYFKNPEVTAGVAPSGDKRNYIAFLDSNGYILGNITLNVTGANSTWLQTGISAKDVNDSSQSIYCGTQYRVYGNGEKYFVPATNGDIYFGTSTLQWKSVYAQSYYYNGTAWGLDKNNKWLTTNLFYGSIPIFLRGSDNDIYNVSPQSLVQSLISFVDKNNTTMSSIVFQHRTEAPETHRLCLRQQKIASNGYYGVNLNNLGDFYPDLNNTINLGTSTNKWKTLNGINPGALSFPGTGGYTDIKGDITNLSGGDNTFTAPYDGWVCVKSTNATAIHIINTYWAVSQSATQSTAGTLCCLCPVMSGQSFKVIVNATSLEYAYIHPCRGNV